MGAGTLGGRDDRTFVCADLCSDARSDDILCSLEVYYRQTLLNIYFFCIWKFLPINTIEDHLKTIKAQFARILK